MDSHLDAIQLADLTADLNVPRLRSRTCSVLAATERLLEEVDRSVSDLTSGHVPTNRLRPEGEHVSKMDELAAVPTLGRSGVPQALVAIAEGAERLRLEVNRVRVGVEKNVELLRGTDLGDDARADVTAAGEFVRQLIVATTDHDPTTIYDAARLTALSDALRNAVSVPGLDFTSESTAFRRPSGQSHHI